MGDNKEEQQHLLEHEPEDITYSRQSRPWKTKAFVLAVASFTVVVLTIALSIYASKPAASSPSKQASSQTVPQVQAVVAPSDKYAGYKVLSVNVKDGQGKLVKDTANQLGLDHWNVGEGKVSVAVPAASLGKTEEWLQNADLTWWTDIDDLQKVIDQEKIAIAGKSKLTSQSEKAFTFQYDNYNTYAQMVAELKHVASDCPDGFTCEVFSIGQTYEKNNLTILHISKRHASNKAIWIDSLIHCREWITGATLMNIIRRLIYNYGTEESVTKLMDGFDWYFLPVMNPDGYIYTWTTVISWQVNLEIVYMLVNEASVNSQAPSDICLFSHLRPDRETKSRPKSGGDRMWRQNREPNRGSECVGTDLNRNYQYMWGGVGASTDPCNNEYRGDHPASAQETQHMQKIIDEMSDDILAWVSLHSCAQMWLTPWAYTEPENPDKCDYPPDYADLFVVADKATKALDKTNGKNFTAGNWCQEMYASSGVLQDHVKAVGKVKYAYTLELRSGEMCFIVDPSEIISSANEVYNGIIAMVDAIDELRNGDLKPC